MTLLKWQVNFSSNFALSFIVMTYKVVKLKVITFVLCTKGSTKVPILTLSSALVKICQISHVIFQTTSLFFVKFCIAIQCHEKQLLFTFAAQTLHTMVTKSQLQHTFLNFRVLGSEFLKFLMSILKREVNSSSIFVSFFIVMKHNTSVIFKLINFLLWTKGPHQCSNFSPFECSRENLPNSSCYFLNHKSFFVQILHHSSMSWKITPL